MGRKDMKNIFPLIVVTLLLVMFLVGCTDGEEKENNDGGGEKDETSTYEKFIGTWRTYTGAGSFSEGNSIRFNNDNTFEKFWDHGGGVYHSGTWDLKDISGENPIIVLKQGEMTYNYAYVFYYGHEQLELIPEGAISGTLYVRQ